MSKDEGRIYELMWRFEVVPSMPLKIVVADIGELEEKTTFVQSKWIVRTWIRAENIEESMDIEKDALREAIDCYAMSCMTPIQLAKALADAFADFLNAVEVLDADGNGGLAYNDWP